MATWYYSLHWLVDGPALAPAVVVVDCWIGVADEGERRVVRLAGRLCEDQVPELLKICEHPTALTLDLTELVYVDDVGIDALHRLLMRGATLVGAPRYIELKLESPARTRSGGRRSKT